MSVSEKPLYSADVESTQDPEVCEPPKIVRCTSAPFNPSNPSKSPDIVDVDQKPIKGKKNIKYLFAENENIIKYNRKDFCTLKKQYNYSDLQFVDFLDEQFLGEDLKRDTDEKELITEHCQITRNISAPPMINCGRTTDNFFGSTVYYQHYYKNQKKYQNKLPPPVYNYQKQQHTSSSQSSLQKKKKNVVNSVAQSVRSVSRHPIKVSSRKHVARRSRRFSQKTWIEDFELANHHSKLKELVNQNVLIQLIRGPDGSCFVGKLLNNATEEESIAVYEVIKPRIIDLSTDRFGYHVAKKVFDILCNGEHVALLIRELFNHIFPLSLNKYGTHIVQKAIEHSSQQLLQMIVDELKNANGIFKCILNENGNHVIQKCIEKAKSRVLKVIVPIFENRISDLSKHVYGCRIVQKLLNHPENQQKLLIIRPIIDETETLCKNQYGNYVIQDIVINDKMDHFNKECQKSIMQKVRNNILVISKNKYGSNVVEKCLSSCDDSEFQKFFDEVIGGGDKWSTAPLEEMLNDKYANYVIQKMLDVATPAQKTIMSSRIHTLEVKIIMPTFAKHIFSQIQPPLPSVPISNWPTPLPPN